MTHFSLQQYDEAAAAIGAASGHRPTIGMVLGSGLSPLAEQIEEADVLPYADIPHFPVSTVHGHAGQLVIGKLAGKSVCAMQGRFHFYEGYSLQQTTFPMRVMQRMGIRTLILTNAAGGVNPNFSVGDLMIMEDHINLIGMAGHSPLRGPNLEAFGTRFPPANRIYTRRLIALVEATGAEIGVRLQRGVYTILAGPNFESPAEIRLLRLLGTDAVGMSTVPEALVAHHAGMEVLAISTITNLAVDDIASDDEPTHEEVNAAGAIIVPKLSKLLLALLAKI